MNSGGHRGSHMHIVIMWHMHMRMSLNPISSQSLTVLFYLGSLSLLHKGV